MVSLKALVVTAVIAAGYAVDASAGSFKLPLERQASHFDALGRRASGEANVKSDMYNFHWTVDLSVGGQNFTLLVDTGSSPLWMLSTRLTASNKTSYSRYPFFDPTKSTTSKNMTGTWNVTYDEGEVGTTGDLGTDNVTIGNLTVNMPIGLAVSTSQDPGSVPQGTSGLLGMAFSAGNQLGPGAPTFMDSVLPQLDEPVFTFSLPVKGDSSLEFGRVDQSLYSGSLQTVAIQNATRRGQSLGWHTYVSYDINGKNVSSYIEDTIFDTGGVEARAAADVVESYWSLVPGSQPPTQKGQNWQFPCNEALPNLTYHLLSVDNKFVTATVPGRFFNGSALLPANVNPGRNGMCQGGLNAVRAGDQGNMGLAFFHSHFTVFNVSDPSVRIAPYPQQELNELPVVSGSLATMQPTITPSALPSTSGQGTLGQSTLTFTRTQGGAGGGNSPAATNPAASTTSSYGAAVAVSVGSVPWVGTGLTALLVLFGL